MLDPKQLTILSVVSIAALLLFRFAHDVKEALEAFQNRFGGGPRPPRYPLQANDAFVVLRRRKRLVASERG